MNKAIAPRFSRHPLNFGGFGAPESLNRADPYPKYSFHDFGR